MSKRFWFYNDWEYESRKPGDSLMEWLETNFMGSDEYGHHTLVIPLGKGRAFVFAYRAGYKGLRKCEDCVAMRKQTLDFEQDARYVQTYWNIKDFEDVYDLEYDKWDEALGV